MKSKKGRNLVPPCPTPSHCVTARRGAGDRIPQTPCVAALRSFWQKGRNLVPPCPTPSHCVTARRGAGDRIPQTPCVAALRSFWQKGRNLVPPCPTPSHCVTARRGAGDRIPQTPCVAALRSFWQKGRNLVPYSFIVVRQYGPEWNTAPRLKSSWSSGVSSRRDVRVMMVSGLPESMASLTRRSGSLP